MPASHATLSAMSSEAASTTLLSLTARHQYRPSGFLRIEKYTRVRLANGRAALKTLRSKIMQDEDGPGDPVARASARALPGATAPAAREPSSAMTESDDPSHGWETWFWAVFAASRNAMAILDADRRVVSTNEALQRLLGHREEDLAGRAIDEALPAADRVAIRDRWQTMLARGQAHGAQDVVAGRDGRLELGFAAHVAHVGGRLVVLVILTPGREGESRASGSDAPAPLTPRELEIVGRLALGATSREIARDLYVTPETVRTHVRNAMAKTGTRTRAHLVAAAICRGFLPAISPN